MASWQFRVVRNPTTFHHLAGGRNSCRAVSRSQQVTFEVEVGEPGGIAASLRPERQHRRRRASYRALAAAKTRQRPLRDPESSSRDAPPRGMAAWTRGGKALCGGEAFLAFLLNRHTGRRAAANTVAGRRHDARSSTGTGRVFGTCLVRHERSGNTVPGGRAQARAGRPAASAGGRSRSRGKGEDQNSQD